MPIASSTRGLARRSSVAALVGSLVGAVAACASAGGRPGYAVASNGAVVDAVPGRQAITSEELRKFGDDRSLYDAIQHRRPLFLHPGLPTGVAPMGTPVTVYLGYQYLGDVATLRSIEVKIVESVRYLSRVDASIQFGRQIPGGAIVVSLR